MSWANNYDGGISPTATNLPLTSSIGSMPFLRHISRLLILISATIDDSCCLSMGFPSRWVLVSDFVNSWYACINASNNMIANTERQTAAPTTVVGVYPWDLPPVTQTSSSSPVPAKTSAFPSGEVEPGVPMRPSSWFDPLFWSSFQSSSDASVHKTWSTTRMYFTVSPNYIHRPFSCASCLKSA